MTKQILAFLFCFKRELNLYSPITLTLTSARELKPFTPPLHPSLNPHPSAKSILNSTYYKQVVKRLKGKTLYYYIQECLSVQNVKMILYPC